MVDKGLNPLPKKSIASSFQSGRNRWILGIAFSLTIGFSASAEDFIVTSVADDGAGSLREAMSDARLNGEADTISFDVTGTIEILDFLPDIDEDLEILGPGADQLAIRRADGAPDFWMFQIRGETTAKIAGLTIANGRFISDGAGVRNFGTLLLEECEIVGNRSLGSGTIFNAKGGDLEVRGCLVTGNVARSGSGLANLDATTLLINSTVSGNTVDAGSGINATISNTSAGGPTRLDIFNSTITANDDDGSGEAHIFNNRTTQNFTPELRLRSTILAGNIGAPDIFNFFGTVQSFGRNFLGTNSSIAGDFLPGLPNANQDYVGNFDAPIDPLLLPLQDNGGPTRTHLPRIDSLVIDSGTGLGAVGPTDQRGEPRVEDGNGDSVAAADIGAAELEDCRRGTVNRGLGPVAEVLLVNGSPGSGPDLRVVVGVRESITLSLAASPAGPGCGYYALYTWRGTSRNPTFFISGGEPVGLLMNPSPFQPLSSPQPFRCVLGEALPPGACKGVRNVPGAPLKTPWSVERAQGLGGPFELTLQALVEDLGSSASNDVSLSNAVILEIQP